VGKVKRDMSKISEIQLYAPVKALLVAQGYDVKGEVGAADVVGVRGEDVVIVELKTGFSLTLLQQGVARQAITDAVYVAVPKWAGKAGWRAFKSNIALCKRLGLGVISVDLAPKTGNDVVQVHCDPVEFKPRKSKVRRNALLREFTRREGDPNKGGMTRTTIMTGYRQEAMRIAVHLSENGPCKGAAVALAVEVTGATRLMADNHYGWFYRVAQGIYTLSDAGAVAVSCNFKGETP